MRQLMRQYPEPTPPSGRLRCARGKGWTVSGWPLILAMSMAASSEQRSQILILAPAACALASLNSLRAQVEPLMTSTSRPVQLPISSAKSTRRNRRTVPSRTSTVMSRVA